MFSNLTPKQVTLDHIRKVIAENPREKSPALYGDSLHRVQVDGQWIAIHPLFNILLGGKQQQTPPLRNQLSALGLTLTAWEHTPGQRTGNVPTGKFIGMSVCPIEVTDGESVQKALDWYDARSEDVTVWQKAANLHAEDLLKTYATQKAELQAKSADVIREWKQKQMTKLAEELAKLQAELGASDKPAKKGKK